MPHLSEEELCDELRDLASRLQRLPRKADMETFGRYSPETYLARFESWAAALDAAGLADRREPHIPRDQLCAHLQGLGDACGHTPTHADCREQGELSAWVYVDRFDSWHAALEAAGYDIASRTDPAATTVTHAELRMALSTLADELGRPPTQTELDTYGDYASALYTAAFGSWDDALALAGLDAQSVRGAPTYSTRTLLANLRALAAQLETSPTTREMNRHGEHSAATYQRRFGSWPAALRAAGLTPTTGDDLPSAEALIDAIQQVTTECGHPPTPAEMRRYSAYTPQTYLIRFDSWGQAIEAAGYDSAQAWDR